MNSDANAQPKTTVFIISNNLMFAYGLESMLNRVSHLKVVGRKKNISQAASKLSSQKPDIILLDNFKKQPDIATLLEATSKSLIITLNLHNNKLYIYRIICWKAEGVKDLLTAIDVSLSTRRKNSFKESSRVGNNHIEEKFSSSESL